MCTLRPVSRKTADREKEEVVHNFFTRSNSPTKGKKTFTKASTPDVKSLPKLSPRLCYHHFTDKIVPSERKGHQVSNPLVNSSGVHRLCLSSSARHLQIRAPTYPSQFVNLQHLLQITQKIFHDSPNCDLPF
ncbi:hypothetical protein EUTSA_v10019313mg [Eutrema salsugineum]|uniref:Uncharacterized protein n=1 Tax=Eutrema salsugineum TaxID=72664 RepID=V4KG39_EUTSA|nr:hypothetical protein EUTSA_v10019313mg [Eutrema salsugineum]